MLILQQHGSTWTGSISNAIAKRIPSRLEDASWQTRNAAFLNRGASDENWFCFRDETRRSLNHRKCPSPMLTVSFLQVFLTFSSNIFRSLRILIWSRALVSLYFLVCRCRGAGRWVLSRLFCELCGWTRSSPGLVNIRSPTACSPPYWPPQSCSTG